MTSDVVYLHCTPQLQPESRWVQHSITHCQNAKARMEVGRGALVSASRQQRRLQDGRRKCTTAWSGGLESTASKLHHATCGNVFKNISEVGPALVRYPWSSNPNCFVVTRVCSFVCVRIDRVLQVHQQETSKKNVVSSPSIVCAAI